MTASSGWNGSSRTVVVARHCVDQTGEYEHQSLSGTAGYPLRRACSAWLAANWRGR
jgi:hypothetical protein